MDVPLPQDGEEEPSEVDASLEVNLNGVKFSVMGTPALRIATLVLLLAWLQYNLGIV